MKKNRNWEQLAMEKRNLNMAVLRVEMYVKPVRISDNLTGHCVKLNRRPYVFKRIHKAKVQHCSNYLLTHLPAYSMEQSPS